MPTMQIDPPAPAADSVRWSGLRPLRLPHSSRPRPGSSIVVAVITDALEDVEVARAAAELAVRPGARLVLAVPLPGEGVLVEQGLPGLPGDLSIPADARAAIGRVQPLLDRYGVRFSVLAVPYRDRGGARRRSRRIATALLRTAHGLRARRLVIGEYACWEPDAPRVAQRLDKAQQASRTGRVAVTVVPLPPLTPESVAATGEEAAVPVP